jgi:hypothetical protein
MMSRRRTGKRPQPQPQLVGPREAEIWIDHDQAVIVEHGPDRRSGVERLDRGPHESEMTFEARMIDQLIDDDRVVVSGPSDARLQFERAYVAVTHRPDRLVDAEPAAPTPRRARRTS